LDISYYINCTYITSALSFTGTLSDTDSKIIENTGSAAPATNTPATLLQTHLQLQLTNKLLLLYKKCQLKAGIFIVICQLN
jgi:hypothetical protein